MADTTEQVIACERCNNTGFIDRDERGQCECPVCDGDPRITFAYVQELARQVDHFRKERDMQEERARRAERSVRELTTTAQELCRQYRSRVPSIMTGEATWGCLINTEKAISDAEHRTC